MRRTLNDMTYTVASAWLLHWPLVILGVLVFKVSGWTPWPSYWAMRRLYCITRGRSTDVLARWLSQAPQVNTGRHGVLDGISAATRASCLSALRTDGFSVLGTLLNDQDCAALREFASTTPATLVPKPSGGPAQALFDPNAPMTVKYDIPEDEVAANPVVQRLLADESLIQLARDYLGSEPVNDLIAMWWSVPSGTASSEAAQLYHFDLDRPKFLKVFFYLTDVTTDTGPHCFIRGSHRDKPAGLWRDGRHTDDAVLAMYAEDRTAEIVGPAGTAIAVDTSGLHKGKPVHAGHRLVLQLEYTCATFGQSCRSVQVAPTPSWQARLAKHPGYLARFKMRER